MIEKLKGPILVLGAGGFIGVNLLTMLLRQRSDVYGVSQSPRANWRLLACHIPRRNMLACDINEATLLMPMLEELRPQTIFQLSAYGAYSKQREYRKIYRTNFNAVVDVIETLKSRGFCAFVQAGSNSEYGTNAAGPEEDAELVPNSHYAVSKVAAHYAIKYYGQIEQLPVINLRLYSAYGPWEEPDRLIPQLLSRARNGGFPRLSNPEVSRDFIHVDDICRAFVSAALLADRYKGQAFNIGTGKKTTLRQLTDIASRLCDLKETPSFNTMPDRGWDLCDWYSQPSKAISKLRWQPEITLEEGLRRTLAWQTEVGFDDALWNWTTHDSPL